MRKTIQMMLAAGAVMAFATAAKAQCNLTISEMLVNSSNTLVQIRVANTGTKASPATGFVALFRNVTTIPACGATTYLARQPVPSIPARSSVWFWFDLGPIPIITRNLLAFVDSTCVIKEKREDDNTRMLTVGGMPGD